MQKRGITAKPVELSDASFNKFISKNDIPVIVDFWAEWCELRKALVLINVIYFTENIR